MDFYFGEKTTEGVVKLENREDVPYLVYHKTDIKGRDFSETPNDDVDSYKNSFVCEKDLEWSSLTISVYYQLILFIIFLFIFRLKKFLINYIVYK